MRNLITPATLANEVQMKRTGHGGSFVLVEGDHDARLYGQLVDSIRCRIVTAHSKANALEAFHLLEARGFDGATVVIDADFDILLDNTPLRSGVFLTDGHDLEMMIMKSQALERVIDEFGSATKIVALLTQAGSDLRTLLLEAASPIGYLRFISVRDSYNFRFDGLECNKFIDEHIACRTEQLITALKNHSNKHDIEDQELLQKVLETKERKYDVWHVCCGHDVCEILGFALRKVLGSRKAIEVTAEVIERSLRLAYNAEYFKMTTLYAKIKAWEQSHPGYTIISF